MLTGYTALVEELKLDVPAPYTESRIEGPARRSEVPADRARETYPKKMAHSGDKDLAEELDFIALYDRAYRAVRDIVDMPNKRLSLFIRLCMQNNGRLAKSRRKTFAELTEAEIAAMEAAIASARRSHEEEKQGLVRVEG
jgi:hypothetical protein